MSGPVLLFDVMDTLVVDPAFTALPEFFGMPVERMFRELRPGLWVEFEKGRISEDEYFRRLFVDGRAVDREAMCACLRDAYSWVEGMGELLRDLHRRGVEMHVLSNYPVWWRMIEERLGLSRYLPWSFVSCMTGVRKPEREAFLGPAAWLGRRPKDLLFIDDRQRNIDGAAAVGVEAILFEGADSLRAELELRIHA